MKIAFADFCKMDFHAQSVDSMPLGGTQSAACYLSRALARLGNEVLLISEVSAPADYDRVQCLNWNTITYEKIRSFDLDALVCMLEPRYAERIQGAINRRTKLVLWAQHHADHPCLQCLKDENARNRYDGFAMVSRWQLEHYKTAYGLDPARCGVMRNAIAPAFENLFAGGSPILPSKTQPPILAYTSAPYRGLEWLLEAFPPIRASVPGARLRVYSSMKPYLESPQRDEQQYGQLYRRCHETEGVEYVGSLAQRELARQMSEVTMLAYPNTFTETSCISVMEAMAAGCRVVTTDFGALPETTAGFARLFQPIPQKDRFIAEFIDAVVQVLGRCASRPHETESFLRRQVNYSNGTNVWDLRAAQWLEWLESLPAK